MADARVTAKELEEAVKSRLEASHTQVTDISGAPFPSYFFHSGILIACRWMWTIVRSCHCTFLLSMPIDGE